jgi:hypothetical protein
MATQTLVTTVFVSKTEALQLLEEKLGLDWILDDPADVTLALGDGAWLSIEVPKFGEDLPLTLDCHHEDAAVLHGVVDQLAKNLSAILGWDTRLLG